MRMFQYAATYASDIAGYDSAWYNENRAAWVLRALRAEYLHPAFENEVLDIETWLSDVKRVRGFREYVVRQQFDNTVIALGQADWVYVDRNTLTPMRIPSQAIEQFKNEPNTSSGMSVWECGEPKYEMTRYERTAQYHEIDMMNHVNNAVYFEWFEQAWAQATGQSPANITGNAVEFIRGAQLGDTLLITSQATSNGVWKQEIRLANSNDLIATSQLRICGS